MKSNSTGKFILIVGLVPAFLLSSTFIWLLNARPVLIEWYYGTGVCDPPFVVLNPLRDREAEKAADEFLERIKAGNTDILNEIVPDAGRLEQIKSGEASTKIKSWFAGDRKEEANKTGITYWIEREYGGGACHTLPAYVGLEKINNNWKVISFNTGY